jgi:hypothetical protein
LGDPLKGNLLLLYKPLHLDAQQVSTRIEVRRHQKPTKLHDVKKLAGHFAALSRFVARLGEKALPFYALMKKSDDKFEWTEEADIAFAQLKKVLSTPPVLVAPNEKEPLLLYIAATHQVVSIVLVVERSEEGKAHVVQRPVYFISEVLSPTK